MARAAPEELFKRTRREGRVWEWMVSSAELHTRKPNGVFDISSTVRRSDGVRVRAVSDAAPQLPPTQRVAPSLEDAYLHPHRAPPRLRRSRVSVVHRLYHLARADFLERVRRRHGFLVTLGFSDLRRLRLSPAPIPATTPPSSYGEYRGVYNSAWVGTAVAMLSAVFISMIGFFIVKNAIERDRSTRVGEILATTPISRVQYTLGKTFSNFAVLAAMALGVVAVACIGTQWSFAPKIAPPRSRSTLLAVPT